MIRFHAIVFLFLLNFSTVSSAEVVDRQQVFIALLSEQFNYEGREARMYGLEFFERMLQNLGQAVKAPTPAEAQWVTSEINKIGNLDTDSMVGALGDLKDNPVYIQRKIERIVSDSEIVVSQIRNSENEMKEAYWWVQLSQLLLEFQEAESWPEILVNSNRSYVPLSSLRGAISVTQGLPPKVNLILLSLLSNSE